ncbi:chemotaxis protein CheA [Spirochaeta africana]|uniref:Chemotaxis protein CheA n=1 Tax=Spirochaeta africana (strain ATCC 700263 / DSM 8902 / Z-7692) TaxID=889378 RepID=H9UK81_SPIAZ|nr:chemotaxis protein CheA [Spirochaeta africana]AFG37924.1 chemotaxis protein histidine kinase-like protein [Spirochaeta africana DSM 8902]
MQDKFRETFKAEALELLQTLESTLLDLENDAADTTSIASVFRVMHTIKGSGAMFGYQHISHFTHELETFMDRIRQGKMQVVPELIDILLQSRDHISVLLETPDPPPQSLQDTSARIIDLVRGVSGNDPDRGVSAVSPAAAAGGASGVQAGRGANGSATGGKPGEVHERPLITYRIRFVPERGLFRNGTNPLALLKELHVLGDCTCVPYVSSMPALAEFDPEDCYLRWDIILTTAAARTEIEDVFLFVQGDCQLQIDPVDDLSFEELEPSKRLGQILIERGVVTQQEIEAAVAAQLRLGQVLQSQGVDAYEIQSALEEQQHIRRSRKKLQDDSAQQSVRVSSDKLDVLVDLVGELVTLQSRLQQTALQLEHPTLVSLSENLQRITTELRDSTLNVRMLPIGAAYAKFRRLVRDLCRQLDKEVDLVTVGGDTELDKTVLEKLTDPLMHIIRNAVDHGIEQPAQRAASGKPSEGTVTLSAEHAGANVIISVTDDGKGLDREAILAKAIDRELVAPGSRLSDADIAGLLTLPGFSTAAEVTELSGRGVGMDVVRQQVEQLGGSFDIGDSDSGGTRVTLVLPLTLAIIDGLLTRVGNDHYVIPLSAVDECLEYREEDADRSRKSDAGQQVMANRGSLLSVVQLRHYFGVANPAPALQQVVVVKHRAGQIGLVVDQVVGSHQTVMKNLGLLYRDIPGISGATILGDGSVALVLDIQRLSAEIEHQEGKLRDT